MCGTHMGEMNTYTLLLGWGECVSMTLWLLTDCVHPLDDTRVNTQHRWNDMNGENQRIQERPLPVLLSPPDTSHGLLQE
jgi:hypothetical protein